MTSRSYGQYCGLAHALDLVGERWALLIVRDLILGPRRFSDLSRGLPGIPSNVLTARLKGLEEQGIVHRRVLPRPEGSVVYELTEYGQELEEIVLRLGLWGARSLSDPREGEVPTPGGLLIALRASFQPDAARKLEASYELHLGEATIHALVDDGLLEIGEGPVAEPDLVIEAGPALRRLMAGEVTPEEAVADGLGVEGDSAFLGQFAELFRLPPPVTSVV